MSTEAFTISESNKVLIKQLKEKLAAYGYRAENLDNTGVSVTTLPLLEYRFSDESPLNTLVKLFLLGLEVESDAVSRVFDEEEIEHLVACDILERNDDGNLESRWKIYPYKNLNLFCDFLHKKRRAEPIYTPGEDSTSLADAGVRLPFESALDLCTGSGIQAIMSSGHTAQTVGVDINPRAVHIATLNLLLNDIDNVSIKEGNLYEPVASDTFDFITANPPFVTSPVNALKYRDGGKRGDELLFKIIEGVPAHLNDGGFCQIVTHLYEFEDLSHVEVMREFAEEHGYEALIFLSAPFDKYDLASSQFRSYIKNYDRYRDEVLNYLNHLDQVRYNKGYLGVITFRNTGQYKFKKMTTLNRPVLFEVNHQSKLEQFFEINM